MQVNGHDAKIIREDIATLQLDGELVLSLSPASGEAPC
jgi:hypothetical protein